MLTPEIVPVVFALLVAVCVAGLVIAVFYSRVSKRSESDKRFRSIAALGELSEDRSAADENSRKRTVEKTLREIEEKRRSRKGSRPSLAHRVRQAGLGWSKQTYYLACGLTGAVACLVGFGGFKIGLLPSLGFGAAGGLLLPHLYVNARRNSRFGKFAKEFPNAVDVIVRGVKAGLPLADCLRIISAEAQEPVRSEFKAVIEDQTLGMPLDQAVQRLAERIPLAEANFFAIVVGMQSRTGGSLSEALGNLSKVLRERKKMQAKIKAVSSEAKTSAGIIGALPVIVALLLYATSPDYISLLFSTFAGNLVLAISGFWMGIGVMVMRKMINFDF